MKKPFRIGFALEQTLGHVAYGMSLKQALSRRSDIECEWIGVPFALGLLGKIPLAGKNWTLRSSVRATRAIGDVNRRRPLDALFIHTQTISLFSAGHMQRIPTVLSVDATPLNYDELARWYGDRVHHASIERLKLWAHRKVMQGPRSFTTWSKWAKDSLVRDYGVDPNKVTIIHPGTVLSNFPNPEPHRTRRPGPLRVLFVGGDFLRKGGDLLLQVARSLAGKVELHLVTSEQAPVAEAPGVFVYRKLTPHSQELLRRYAEADVFALPTRGDCLAVVLGEAMASSLPIITTRVGAHPEAVEDGASGYVIGVDDAEALRSRLLELADKPEIVSRMGRRSRQIAEDRFDMDKNANRIADMLVALHAGRT